jgi:zinc transport system substrate-binding protein
MQTAKKYIRKSWMLAIGLFLIGLMIGGTMIGMLNSPSSRGVDAASRSVVTATTTATIAANAQNSKSPVLNVLATFFPLQDWAANVGGNKANVSLLVPVEIDVHDFEPGPADIQAIAKANLLILNGVDLEPWAPAALAAANNPHLVVVDCSKGIQLLKLPAKFQESNRTLDPHIWNDPVDAIAMVKNILGGYIQADPSDSAYFTANANAYISSLQVLNQEFIDLSNSKLATRSFVTFHTAWGYFAQRYKFTQVPVFGPFEEDPTPADIQNVVFVINQNKFCYVGYESIENQAIPQSIASQTHATLIPMDPNEGLTDRQVAIGETYLTMMQVMLIMMTLALQNVGC